MKKSIIKKITAIGMSLALVTSSVAFLCDYTYAEEPCVLTLEEASLQGLTEDGVVVGVEEEYTEEFSENIYRDYKPWLEELLSDMPSTIVVKVEDEDTGELSDVEVPVSWNCIGDYDENAESFEFEPVIEDIDIAGGADIPTITVETIYEEPVSDGIVFDENEIDVLETWENVGTPEVIETSYNNKERDVLPEVRNQGSYGICWAFASIGAMECDLISKGEADTSIDLSELALGYFVTHEYDDPKDKHDDDTVQTTGNHLQVGGNFNLSSRFLVNNVGAVSEANVPYSIGTGDVDESFAVSNNYATAVNIYKIPISDMNSVKAAIKEHGGVATYMNMDDYGNYYSSTYNSYCTNQTGSNHGVMLVGWDDNFPAANFSNDCKPTANGAWLVRNSWGSYNTEYNKNGYFWMSYEDAGLLGGGEVVVFEAELDGYENCYSYASSPFIDSQAFSISSGSTIGQSYVVSAGETIEAVGLEVFTGNLKAEATVTVGQQSSTGTIDCDRAGNYTIKLDDAISVETESTANISIKFTKSDGKITIAREPVGTTVYPDISKPNYTSYTGVKSGTSYVNGIQTSNDLYIRLYTNETDTDYTDERTSVSGLTITLEKESYTYDGNAKEPTVTVVDGTKTLEKGTDFTVSYHDNINAGNPYVKITGIGSYKNSVNKYFKIEKASQNLKADISKSLLTVGDKANVSYSDSIGRVTFSSDNPGIANVNSSGVVTAKSAGTVAINVKAAGNNNYNAATKVLNVTVKAKNPTPAPTPAPTPTPTPKPTPKPTVTYTSMYRLYNPNSGEHFYTKSVGERNNLVAAGWKYEGIAWSAPSKGSPVYRMYNPNAGDHHYTTSVSEKNMLLSVGWRYEGIGWYSGSGTPLYRAYNPNAVAGSHHYTTSMSEIVMLLSYGWRFEGIAWYGK